MCTNQDISNIPFIMMRKHFLVHGHKKDLPHNTCIFHLLKYVVNLFLVSAILHHISLLRLLPKSYFKMSTFQPNFLCSSSFNIMINLVLLASVIQIYIYFLFYLFPNIQNRFHATRIKCNYYNSFKYIGFRVLDIYYSYSYFLRTSIYI